MPNTYIFLIMLIILTLNVYISIISRLSGFENLINQDYQGYQDYQDFILRKLIILDSPKILKISISQRHQNARSMLKEFQGRCKKVDIILIIRHTFYLIENKVITWSINQEFLTGQTFKISSQFRLYLALIWPLLSQIRRFFEIYFPFLIIARIRHG